MKKTTKKLIILDRDGVINEDLWGYVTNKKEFTPIEGSLEAIANLSKAGFLIVIATNQACINKNIIEKKDLEEIHNYMIDLIEEAGGSIEFIAFCPHRPDELCKCRKPEVGLLEKIEQSLGLSLKGSYFIGDKASDILCAETFGCRPILVKTGYGAKTLQSANFTGIEKVYDNLFSAVKDILSL